MTADTLLAVIGAGVCGYGLGYIQAWVFARKLEVNGVKLSSWTETDLAARRPAPPRLVYPGQEPTR